VPAPPPRRPPRQTDLIAAAARTGRVLHIKKGQFASAEAMHQQKEKAMAAGAGGVILCERGTFFG
jgi:2-dehydro-3-deoxyphosphooctonate aldolase (KDO 8-P synthase)